MKTKLFIVKRHGKSLKSFQTFANALYYSKKCGLNDLVIEEINTIRPERYLIY